MRFMLILLVALVSWGCPTKEEDRWVKTPVTGCKVWAGDEKDVEKDVVTWSGECRNGYASGSGVLTWVRDGKLLYRYKGGMKGGKAEGFAVLDALTDDGYDRYEARFVNGEINGDTVLVAANGDRFEGTLRETGVQGYGIYIEANGARYDGEFKNGVPDGKGSTVAADGEQYRGEFRNGERNGQGVLLEPNGERFSGTFAAGKPVKGTWQGTDGSTFTGTFRKDKPHGPGTYKTPDGYVIQADFVKGVARGKVVITGADGTRSVQVWKKGKRIK